MSSDAARLVRLLIVPLTALLASGTLGTDATAADPMNLMQCGVIRSVQSPTASTAGSIAIGSRTFAIDMSVQPSALGSIPLGETRCVSGPMLQTQTFTGLTFGPIPESVCGVVRVAVAPTTAAGGVAIGSDPELVLKVPIGAALPAVQGTTQCLSISIDSAGDAIYAGIRPGALPNTSTSRGSGELARLISAFAGLVVLCSAALALRRRFGTQDRKEMHAS